MPGKKKPPIDKKSVLARLERAQTDTLSTRLKRWIPEADPIDGFVVGIGRRWVVLAKLSGRADIDGWMFVRIKDIQNVGIEPDTDCFDIRALKARGQWPPPSVPVVDLDDLAGVISSAESGGPLLSVYKEFALPDACWIGRVTSLDADALRLHEVNVGGDWAKESKAKAFDPADVTRVEVGGGYEEALHLVAGPPPESA
jgi:hypothetical protein